MLGASCERLVCSQLNGFLNERLEMEEEEKEDMEEKEETKPKEAWPCLYMPNLRLNLHMCERRCNIGTACVKQHVA